YMADAQWEDPLPDGMTNQTRYWIDDVYMVGALQTEAHRATGDVKYLDRAALFAATYVDSLQQPNGLFYHGPEAPVFWGRGNGWMAAGLTEVVSGLPKDHPHYATIVAGYQRMMARLLAYQGKNGLWKQVLDLPESWDETSCSAMFAYAMAKGVQLGLLDSDPYQAAVHNAWNALRARVNENGELTGVSVGTSQATQPDYYLRRERKDGDFHGQAPLLWLINALFSAQ
ncbi:MAG: glycoside hydrolase family 88 protein, partial [Saprospiraceae bacterium]|nr:glycoside hydrolase family 88 protein [Saprospiraceae bacterium]